MSTNPKIFLSYRRDDSAFQTTAIHEKLTDTFGAQNVFMDVDNIPAGRDFRRHLQLAVEQCDVCLIVIGDRWLNAGESAAGRRIDDPRDFVRIEVEAALKRDIPVIPLMVGKSPMPTASELPDCIAELSYRQGLSVRPGRDFRADMQLLINQIRQNTEPSPKSASVPVPAALVQDVVATSAPAPAPVEHVIAAVAAITPSAAPPTPAVLAEQVSVDGASAVDQQPALPSRSLLQNVSWPVIQISRAYERLLDYFAASPIRLLAALAIILYIFLVPTYIHAKSLSWNHPDLQAWVFWLNPLLLISCVLPGSWCRRRIDRFAAVWLPVVPSAVRADASVLLILGLVRALFAAISGVLPENSFSFWLDKQGLLAFGVALAGLAPLSHTASVGYRGRLLRTIIAAAIWPLLLVCLKPIMGKYDTWGWYYPGNAGCTAFWVLTAIGVDGMTKFWLKDKPAG